MLYFLFLKFKKKNSSLPWIFKILRKVNEFLFSIYLNLYIKNICKINYFIIFKFILIIWKE